MTYKKYNNYMASGSANHWQNAYYRMKGILDKHDQPSEISKAKLTKKDFTKIYFMGAGNKYFFKWACEDSGVSACLEPCPNGFYAALYDEDNNLIRRKKRTRFKPDEAWILKEMFETQPRSEAIWNEGLTILNGFITSYNNLIKAKKMKLTKKGPGKYAKTDQTIEDDDDELDQWDTTTTYPKWQTATTTLPGSSGTARVGQSLGQVTTTSTSDPNQLKAASPPNSLVAQSTTLEELKKEKNALQKALAHWRNRS